MEECLKVIFSEYAARTINDALLDSCIKLCEEGTVDEIMTFIPFFMRLAKDDCRLICVNPPSEPNIYIDEPNQEDFQDLLADVEKAIKRRGIARCLL